MTPRPVGRDDHGRGNTGAGTEAFSKLSTLPAIVGLFRIAMAVAWTLLFYAWWLLGIPSGRAAPSY